MPGQPIRIGNTVTPTTGRGTISTDGQPGSLAACGTRRQPDIKRLRGTPIAIRLPDLRDADVVPGGDLAGLGISSKGGF